MSDATPVTVVIGSGPTGFAAAHRLVKLGYRPIVLDGGTTLDTDRRRMADRLAAHPPAPLSEADSALLTGDRATVRPLPRHLAFGSGYPYADHDERAPIDCDFPGAPVPSLAVGGLSSVWSGAMLPIAEADLASWPIGAADLAPHYRAVMQQVPLSGGEDPLHRDFPLYTASVGKLPIPTAATTILTRLLRRGRARPDHGIIAGHARVAVQSEPENSLACRACGRCHLGCAYGSIWSSAPPLERLAANGSIDHRPGTVVRRIIERDDRVAVAADGPSGPVTIEADRVFVAAGAIASTRIVLESLGLWDRPVRLATTQGFGLPILLPPGMIVYTRPTSLASLFIESRLADSPHWVHTQIGPVNQLTQTELARRLKRLPGGDALATLVARRPLAALGNLHSSEAGHHLLTLTRQPGRIPELRIRTVANDRFPARARMAAHPVRRALARAGVATLPPRGQLVDQRPVSWHVGGSLPMRHQRRSPLDTDVLGRPSAWRRTHVVDTSVFPDLPATTVTLPAMANADRIVTLAMTNQQEEPADG